MKKNIIVKKNSVTYQIPPQNVVYMEKDLRRIMKTSIDNQFTAQDRDSSFGNGEQ